MRMMRRWTRSSRLLLAGCAEVDRPPGHVFETARETRYAMPVPLPPDLQHTAEIRFARSGVAQLCLHGAGRPAEIHHRRG